MFPLKHLKSIYFYLKKIFNYFATLFSVCPLGDPELLEPATQPRMAEGVGDSGTPPATPASRPLLPHPVSRDSGSGAKASLQGAGRSLHGGHATWVSLGWGVPRRAPSWPGSLELGGTRNNNGQWLSVPPLPQTLEPGRLGESAEEARRFQTPTAAMCRPGLHPERSQPGVKRRL